MIRRSLILLSLVATLAGLAAAQQTPEAKKEKEKAAQTFAFSFAGDGGYLGVQTVEVNKENFGKFGLRDVRGVAVEKVMEDSPASAAGIQSGDVIVKFNGEEVTSARKLTRLIGETDPDHQARITVLRGGSEREITVTIGKRPAPAIAPGSFAYTFPPQGRVEMPEFPRGEFPGVFVPGGQGNVFAIGGNARQIGVGVTPLTKQLADHFNVSDGLLVSEVREGSPASKAGIKAGDIITEADGKAIKGQVDLVRAVNEKKEGDLKLTIVRGGNRQTISVTPEAAKDGGFFYKFDDKDMPDVPAPPAEPGQFRLVRPTTPSAPLTIMRPGRII